MTLPVAVACLLLAALLSICTGRYPLPLADLARLAAPGLATDFGLGHRTADRVRLVHAVLLGSRPRVIDATLVGAALSISDAAFQRCFGTPRSRPACSACLAVPASEQRSASCSAATRLRSRLLVFGGGLAVVADCVGVARLFGDSSIIMLALGGLISNALFTSLLSILEHGADPTDQLPTIVFWLLGSLDR